MSLRRDLDETLRLLAESDARIEQLRQRVAEFEMATVRAKSVLREFEDTRLLIVAHRDTLIRQLTRDEQSTPPPLLEPNLKAG